MLKPPARASSGLCRRVPGFLWLVLDVICSHMHWQGQEDMRKLIRKHALHFKKRGAKIAVTADVRPGAVSAGWLQGWVQDEHPSEKSGTCQKEEFLSNTAVRSAKLAFQPHIPKALSLKTLNQCWFWTFADHGASWCYQGSEPVGESKIATATSRVVLRLAEEKLDSLEQCSGAVAAAPKKLRLCETCGVRGVPLCTARCRSGKCLRCVDLAKTGKTWEWKLLRDSNQGPESCCSALAEERATSPLHPRRFLKTVESFFDVDNTYSRCHEASLC